MARLKRGITVPKLSPKIVSNNRGLSDTTRAAASDSAQLTNTPNVYDHVALQERARSYARASLAPNTKIAYARAWRAFQAWCGPQGLSALPAAPATVSLYLAAKAPALKVSTLALALSAIRHAHRMAGENLDASHPEVRAVFAGIRRTHGKAPRRVSPLPLEVLKQAATELEIAGDPLSIRNRAILLIGFCAALRRSEIVTLRVQDIEFVSEGMKIRLAKRKTDQDGNGTWIGVPFGLTFSTCPVRALQQWLQLLPAKITSDPLFQSISKSGRVSGRGLDGRDIARIVRAIVINAGLNPMAYSGHSLRAGFATSAAAYGAGERSIMAQTGHKSVTTARTYIRTGELFLDNPVARFRL